jgi:anti-sigma-K factor RskA
MNAAPNNPPLLDRLAAEYVLGTLRGAARARLERWRASSAALDQRCVYWEERLLPLLRAIKPVHPPAQLWRGIQQRLNLPVTAPPRATPWRSFAMAASVLLVLAVGALFYWRSVTPGSPMEVAKIATPTGTVMWQVEILGREGQARRLDVHAGAGAARPDGHDYELWALPKGGKPVSLGLLPYDTAAAARPLTAAQQQALASAAQLAVSIEPQGGSPTGQPTGAVVFVAPLQTVS